MLEQRVARGALIRAGAKWLDVRSCPVNPDVITLCGLSFDVVPA